MKKKILAIAALTFLVGGACIQANKHSDDNSNNSVSATLQKGDFRTIIKKDFDAADVKSMDVRTVSANVDVIGDATGTATVEVLAKGPNNKSLSATEIQERLDKYYRITTELNGGQLDVKVEFKTRSISNNEGLVLRFILHTPATADAKIKSVSGDVALSQAAKASVTTTSGDIKIGTLTRDGIMGSVSGDIEAKVVQGNFSAATTSGNIEAGAVGALLDARSVSGDIQIVAGIIGKDVNMKTVSGDVKLKISENVGMNLSLSTLSGDMDIEDLGPISYSNKSKRNVDAKVNGGGKTLDIETVSGDIHISKS